EAVHASVDILGTRISRVYDEAAAYIAGQLYWVNKDLAARRAGQSRNIAPVGVPTFHEGIARNIARALAGRAGASVPADRLQELRRAIIAAYPGLQMNPDVPEPVNGVRTVPCSR